MPKLFATIFTTTTTLFKTSKTRKNKQVVQRWSGYTVFDLNGVESRDQARLWSRETRGLGKSVTLQWPKKRTEIHRKVHSLEQAV